MSGDIVEKLRRWQESDGNRHQSGSAVPTHCEICSERMPCDWRLAVDEMAEAADEIERLLKALDQGNPEDCDDPWVCCLSTHRAYAEQIEADRAAFLAAPTREENS